MKKMKTTLLKGVMVLDELPKNCRECKFCAPLQGEKLEFYNKPENEYVRDDYLPYECLACGYSKSFYSSHLICDLDIRPTYGNKPSNSLTCPFISEKDYLVYHCLGRIKSDIEFDRIYSEEE